jgi:hypothetical protein
MDPDPDPGGPKHVDPVPDLDLNESFHKTFVSKEVIKRYSLLAHSCMVRDGKVRYL